MNDTFKVAVYGTLKKGYGNHRLLVTAQPIGVGTVEGFRLYSSGIPFLVEDKSSEYDVHVECYEVNVQQLRSLDLLEGHPDFYERKLVDVRTDTGEMQTMWIYTYPEPRGVEISTGIY